MMCFTADTQILMDDLSTKYIDQITIGEYVTAYDVATSSWHIGKVDKIKSYVSNHIVIVTFDDNTILKLTRNHPILSNTGWVAIDPILAYKEIHLKTDMMEIEQTILGYFKNKKIKNIQYNDEQIQVYNLEIKDYHTYVANDCIVHNKHL